VAAALLCTSCTGGVETPSKDRGELVPIYRFDGHALLPEYEPLPEGDPAQGLIGLLGDPPNDSNLSSFVPEGSFESSSEREGAREQLVLRLSDRFWDRPAGEVYAGAAQIIFTVATLEQGREVLLLDGTVPGEVLDGSFEPVVQPLDRELFEDVKPWIELVRPVAGAVVGKRLPVEVRLRQGTADVELLRATQGVEEVLAGERTRSGSVILQVEADAGGNVILSVEVGEHSVRVPLTLTL
jgi:hypothetical protein